MCIRDSARSADDIADEGTLPDRERLDGLDRYRTELDAIEAVSYTHLRAHETVLDLVCRLLLEKKNPEHQHVFMLYVNKTTDTITMQRLVYNNTRDYRTT